jgi:hypothetical protein
MRATIRLKETKHGRLYTEVTRPTGTIQLILPMFADGHAPPRESARVLPFRGKR